MPPLAGVITHLATSTDVLNNGSQLHDGAYVGDGRMAVTAPNNPDYIQLLDVSTDGPPTLLATKTDHAFNNERILYDPDESRYLVSAATNDGGIGGPRLSVFQEGTVTQLATQTHSDPGSNGIGYAVAILGNGNTLMQVIDRSSASDNNGWCIWDVSGVVPAVRNYTLGSFMALIATDGWLAAARRSSNYAYIASNGVFSGGTHPLLAVNLADPTTPVTASIGIPISAGHNSFVPFAMHVHNSNNFLYVVTHSPAQIRVYDISSPMAPTLVRIVSTAPDGGAFPTCRRLTQAGSYLFGGDGSTFGIFDVTDASNPILYARGSSTDVVAVHSIRSHRLAVVRSSGAVSIFSHTASTDPVIGKMSTT